VPASNHPGLRPTRGSGLGFVVPTTVFGAGAELAEAEEEPLDAQPAAVKAVTAIEKNDLGLMGAERLADG
jgi:hypothetical protein